MYERMLDKTNKPDGTQIRACLGKDSYARLLNFEEALAARYDLHRELRFPFGSQYGWGYKYSHKSLHLCYAFFEQGAFTVMVQVGDRQVPALEKQMAALSPKARDVWAGRYPCGNTGGWVRDRVLEDADLADVLRFVEAKKAPVPKK